MRFKLNSKTLLIVLGSVVLVNLFRYASCSPSDNSKVIKTNGSAERKGIMLKTKSSSSENANKPWMNKLKPLILKSSPTMTSMTSMTSSKGASPAKKLVRRISRKGAQGKGINLVNRSLYNRLMERRAKAAQEESSSSDSEDAPTTKDPKKDMLLIPVPESQRRPYHPVIVQKKESGESANYKLNKMFVPLGIYGKVVKDLEDIRKNATRSGKKKGKKSKGHKKAKKGGRSRDFEFDPTGLLTTDYKGDTSRIYLTTTPLPRDFLSKIDMTTPRSQSLHHQYDEWKGVLNPPLPNERNTYNPSGSNPGLLSKLVTNAVSSIPGMIYSSMQTLKQIKSPFDPEDSDQVLFPKVATTKEEAVGGETLEYFRKRPHLLFKKERALGGFRPVKGPAERSERSRDQGPRARMLEDPEVQPSSVQETDESFNAKWKEIANKYSLEELTQARNRIFEQILHKDQPEERSDRPLVKEDRGTLQDYYFDLMSLKSPQGSPTSAKKKVDSGRVDSAFGELLHLFRFSVKAEKMNFPGKKPTPKVSQMDQVIAGSAPYESFATGPSGPSPDADAGWRPITQGISSLYSKAIANSPVPIPSMFHFKAGVSFPKHPGSSSFEESPSDAVSSFKSPSLSASYISSGPSAPSSGGLIASSSSYRSKYTSPKNPDIEIIPSSEFYKMNLDTHSIAAVIRPPGMSDAELKAELAPVFATSAPKVIQHPLNALPSSNGFSFPTKGGSHYSGNAVRTPEVAPPSQFNYNLPAVLNYSPQEFSSIMSAINSGVRINPGPAYNAPPTGNSGPNGGSLFSSNYQIPSNIDPDIAALIKAELDKDDVPFEYRQDFNNNNGRQQQQQSQIVPQFAAPPAAPPQKLPQPFPVTAEPNSQVKFHKPIPLLITERTKPPRGKKGKKKGVQPPPPINTKAMPKYVVDLAKKLQSDKNVQGIVRVSRVVDGVVKEYLYPVRG